jgi:hypothetical protein
MWPFLYLLEMIKIAISLFGSPLFEVEVIDT